MHRHHRGVSAKRSASRPTSRHAVGTIVNPTPHSPAPVRIAGPRPINLYARPAAPPRRAAPPYESTTATLALDHAEDPVNHRWLLTSCIAGVIGTLVIGGSLMGFFGQRQDLAERSGYADVGSAPQDKALTTASLGPSKEVIPVRALVGDNNYPVITSQELPYGDGKTVVLDAEIQDSENETTNITTISKTPPSEPVDETFTVAEGRTLSDELVDRGVSVDVAQSLVAAIEPIFPARFIKPGMNFDLTLDRQQDFYGRDATFPVALSFKPGPKERISVEVDDDGQFIARLDGNGDAATSQYAAVTQFKAQAKVGASLYATAKDNGVPDYIVNEFIRVFSYDVDFQRQVKPSDSFEIFYGNPLTRSSTKRKVLHYAQLTIDGDTKTYYRYVDKNGRVDYVDETGRGASKALLKTPISGSKLTSGFGFRRHPLMGYTKMHTGLDFGAAPGTPIRAAASGVVKRAGRNGAYGIAVILTHNKRVETLYGHMSKMAAGIHEGSRVNQGQVIGYVGSTGRSTGPHLHYEVRVGSRPVNPLKIKTSSRTQLAGKDLKSFQLYKQQVLTLMQTAPSPSQVAQNSAQ